MTRVLNSIPLRFAAGVLLVLSLSSPLLAQPGDGAIDSRRAALDALRRAKAALLLGEQDEAARLLGAAADFAKTNNDALVAAWSQQMLGESAFAAGKLEAAQAAYLAALEGFARLEDQQPALAACRVNLGRLYAALGRPAEGVAQLEAAVAAYEKLARPAELAAALADLGEAQLAAGKHADAIAALERALASSAAASDARVKLRTLTALGSACLQAKQADTALRHLQAAAALAGAEDRAAQAEIEHLLALGLQQQGKREESLVHYQAALRLAAEHKSAAGEAAVLNNLGAMYLEQGQAAEAQAALARAVELYTTAVKDDAGLARAHYNVALVCEAQGKTIEAVAAYEKSLEIRRRIDRAGAARILDSLALLHATVGDVAKAKACRDEAAKLRQ
jgi:tetratricopeptide (TPR) repeat protein